MTEKERLLAVFNKHTPDKTPWFADLSYLYNSMIATKTLDKRFMGEDGYLEFHKELGAGICFYAPFPWKVIYSDKISYSTKISGNERMTEFRTPIGNLSCLEHYLPETYSWAITKHYVNSIEDMKIMEYIHEQTNYEENYSDFSRTSELWGDYGIAVAMPVIASAPFQKMLARWAGVENTVILHMDHEDNFKTLLEAIEFSELPVFDILCNSPCEYVEYAENLSSEVTGAGFFCEFNMPHYKKRNDLLHRAGKFTGIHIDGTLKPCLSMLAECGFDAAEAVTPYPIGDIKLKDLRKEAGDELIIWGGLPGALFSPQYSETQFISHLEEILQTFHRDTGFILGVADQVPPDGLIHRIEIVREMVDRQL